MLQKRNKVFLSMLSIFLFLPRQWRPGFSSRLPFFFLVQSQIALSVVSRAHASLVHAHGTWNFQKLSSWKASLDSMISMAMKSHTNEHTVRGRPTLKVVKRFRKGSVWKAYQRSILSEFTKNCQESCYYQSSYQPGLSTLRLDMIFRSLFLILDVIVNHPSTTA